MAYSTLEDLYNNLPGEQVIQLTDDDEMGEVNLEVIDEANLWADDVIDSYCRGKYPTPLSPVPEMIKKISIDLVVSFLYTRRFQADVPDGITSRYKNAIRQLKDVQKGIVTLDVDTGTQDTSEIRTNKIEDDRIYDSDLWDIY